MDNRQALSHRLCREGGGTGGTGKINKPFLKQIPEESLSNLRVIAYYFNDLLV